jgi:Tol biopolymer transport system component
VESGHVLYVSDGELQTAPFDLSTLTVTGPAVRLAENVSWSSRSGTLQLAVAGNGTLAYAMPSGTTGGDLELWWVDAEGRSETAVIEKHNYSDLRLSPDGRRVATHLFEDENDVWVWDLVRGDSTRITFEPSEDETPIWSPDGLSLAYASSREGKRVVYLKRADGSASAVEQVIWEGSEHLHLNDWSAADGRILAEVNRGSNDLIAIDVESGEETPLLQSSFNEKMSRLSPDGRWMAYVSNESGEDRVYVQRYPELDLRVPVSTADGYEPLWSPDGRTLFFRSSEGVMAAPVVSAEPLEFAVPRVLFPDTYARTQAGNHFHFDVAADGRFLLVGDPLANESRGGVRERIVVTLNWTEELARLAPASR